MKTTSLFSLAIVAISTLFVFSSCGKEGIKVPVTIDKASGDWVIHGIRYMIYPNGSSIAKDSTIPWKPTPRNYAIFDGVSGLKYCFNSTACTPGSYRLIGNDSIELTMNNQVTRWKIDLLTATNFNISSTSTNNRNFPGAKVITYQGFIK